ncbi:MAG: MFS transporter [Promethearchaeota archaeon]
MSTESTTAKPFKPDKISRGKMASYGMGPFIQGLTWSSYDLLLLYYYEVELGLSIALVGLSFVIYAIWNMVNDPLVGFLTDKPMRWSKRFGLRTPWIIFSGILLIISYYFLYAVPDVGDVKSNPWPLFWYMVIMTCIFDTFFSIYSSHYLGGFANIFRTKEERRKGSMIMGLVTLFSGVFIRVVVIGNILVYGDPSSFVRAALLTAVVCVICLLLFIPGIYENEFVKNRYLQIYEFLETQKLPYFKLLKITFKQKNYMIFLVAFTLFQTAQTLNRASELFMLKDVLKADLSIMVIVGFVLMITIIPSIFAWSYIAKKIGHANVYTICLFAFGIGYFLWMLIASVTHFVLIVVYMGIATGILYFYNLFSVSRYE